MSQAVRTMAVNDILLGLFANPLVWSGHLCMICRVQPISPPTSKCVFSQLPVGAKSDHLKVGDVTAVGFLGVSEL